jgi:hypothetical protein
MAERARRGCAAKSIQRMCARRAAPCRVQAATMSDGKLRRLRILRSKDRHRKNRRHSVPNFLPRLGRARVRFCSIGLPHGAAVWRAWNETGIRSATVRFWLRSRRTRNDSRLRSRSRMSAQQQGNARSLSCYIQSFTGCECSNIFFRLDNGRDLGRRSAINPGRSRRGRSYRCLLEARGH